MRDWGDTEGLRRGKAQERERKRDRRRRRDCVQSRCRLRGVALALQSACVRAGSRARDRAHSIVLKAVCVDSRRRGAEEANVARHRRAQRTAERGHRRGDRAHEGQGKTAHETAKGGVQEWRTDEMREEEGDKEKRKEEGARGLRIVSYPRGKVKGARLWCTTSMLTKLRARIRARPQQRAAHHPQIRCGASQLVADALEEGARVGRTRHPSLPYHFAPLSPSVRSANRGSSGESMRIIWLEERQGREGEGRGEKGKGVPEHAVLRAYASSLLRLPSMGERRGGGGGGRGEEVLREVLRVRSSSVSDITSSSGIGIAALLLRLAHRSRHAIRYALAPIPIPARSIHLATHVLLETSSPRPLAARSLNLRSLSRFLSFLSPFYPAATCTPAASRVYAVRFACMSKTASGTSEPASSSSESHSGGGGASKEAAEDEGQGRAGGIVERVFVRGAGVVLGKEEARKRKGESEHWGFGRTSSRAAKHMAHAARRTDVQYGGAPTRLKPSRARRRPLLIAAAACARFAYVRATALGASAPVPSLSESCSGAAAGNFDPGLDPRHRCRHRRDRKRGTAGGRAASSSKEEVSRSVRGPMTSRCIMTRSAASDRHPAASRKIQLCL
ncbi:hypothetical protein DFH09DRAFT_1422829 [Mycena vulgaris]|nr:hypothetical protein DFH09DRAFT_1422829 [Mycena vulgaris]